MQGIALRYFHNWINDEDLETYFRKTKIICKGNNNYVICEALINNEIGINEIRIYKREIVALSVDGNEVLYGKKAIIPLENG